MYKLIALDMDGTLLREDGSISARTQRAIAEAKAKGVRVVLASGRPLSGMARFLDQLALTSHQDYVLSYNGALIQNVGSGDVLSRNVLTGKDVRELYRLSQQLGVNIHAFSHTRGLIAPRTSRYTEVERSHNDLTLTLVDFAAIPEDEAILKVMMVDEPALLAEAMAQLPETVYQHYTVLLSTPYFLEFLHPHSNKGNGVAQLAAHLSIEPQAVICVGDAGNDAHMIDFAGLGVAMGNATDALKQQADYITLSNEDDGVAHVIEKFILKQP
ncbi:sugar-phosphatase [Pseudaeromonas sharmana]|uniref:Sugar-phosphatase n=1 Tax=Pseudaeromonas sharmana TaxID=328412 RepID=A0ABV8CIF8_9GAMM